MGFDKKKKGPKGRQTKWTLTYDEEDQRDYLLGFRKRKDERRKKAKEEKREAMTEMRRQLKKEKLDFVKDRVKKVRHLLPKDIQEKEEEEEEEEKQNEETVDYDNHTVTVTDLSNTGGFASQPSYRDTLEVSSGEEDEEEEEEEKEEEEESGNSYSVDGYKKKSREIHDKLQRIEGKHVNKKQMFLQRKQKKKIQKKLKMKLKKRK